MPGGVEDVSSLRFHQHIVDFQRIRMALSSKSVNVSPHWNAAPPSWPTAWYADNASIIADSPVKLQSVATHWYVHGQAQYSFLLSEVSLDIIARSGGDRDITSMQADVSLHDNLSQSEESP